MKARALLLLLCSCTSPPKPPACADTCAGCCDAAGACQSGTESTSCGQGGAECASCASTQQCLSQRCEAPPPPPGCNATTCSGCCDDGGTCLAGRSPSICGEGGAACLSCDPGKLCSAGACITVTQCDLSCGAQCCRGEGCAATPCGSDGGSCATCPSGQLCMSGACSAAAGTLWKLRVVSARIAATRPNGDPWDDKNDPDPKVCANVGDAGQSCTLELGETFTPAWSMTFVPAYTLDQLSQVELSVIDVDYPGQTVIDELGALDLRPRWSGATQTWTIDGASVTQLRLDVVPQ